VVALTIVMMVAELVGGTVFGSMALLADGWHMGTHAAAMALPCLPTLLRVAMRKIPALALEQARYFHLLVLVAR
jgi:Co/Zn/Cd efflux system component